MAIDLGDIPSGTEPTTAEKLQIRKAIGVGTIDAPTFLAQTLTGQSLTGTQATSLVDLATTWDTTGTPTGIKLDVTNTNSNVASKLLDLRVDGQSKFNVSKGGEFSFRSGSNFASISTDGTGRILLNSSTSAGARVVGDLLIGSNDVVLVRDSAPGILAQRNGTNAQAFRVYNSTDATPATNFDRASFGFTSNVLRIGTENGGTYTTARPIDFVVGGVVRMSIGSAIASVPGSFNAAGYSVTGSFIGALGHNGVAISVGSNVWNTQHEGLMLAFRGTTAAFPGLKRSTVALQTTYLQARLADDSAFTNIQGKLTTDTAYTATTVVATGYITLYDSTGTAYRVPCAV